MMFRTLLVAFSALGLSSCMTAAALYQARLEAVSAEDFAWAAGAGPATLVGQALTDETLLTDGGCQHVELRPAGFGAELGPAGMGLLMPAPSAIDGVTRRATCDASGRFRFEDVPVGRYYVVAQVPTENSAFTGERARESLWKEVRLRGGTQDVELRRVCETFLRKGENPRRTDPARSCGLAPLRPPEGAFRPRKPEDRAIVEAADAGARKPVFFVRNDSDRKARVEVAYRDASCGSLENLSASFELAAGGVSKFFCGPRDFASITFVQDGIRCQIGAERLALLGPVLPLSWCRSARPAFSSPGPCRAPGERSPPTLN